MADAAQAWCLLSNLRAGATRHLWLESRSSAARQAQPNAGPTPVRCRASSSGVRLGVDAVTVDTEKDAERGGAAPATDFIGYLSEHKVQLREGVTPEQFAAEAEALAHELARATVATKGIFKTPVIASQFEAIAEHASSIADVLNKSPLVRDDMEWLLALRLLESWGRQGFRSEGEFLTDERRRAIEQESERIHDFLATHAVMDNVLHFQLRIGICHVAIADRHGHHTVNRAQPFV